MEGVSRDFAEAVLMKVRNMKWTGSSSNYSMDQSNNKSMVGEDGFATAYDYVVREFIKLGRIEELPEYIRTRIREQSESKNKSLSKQDITVMDKNEAKVEFSKIEDVILNLREFSEQLSVRIKELSYKLNIY